MVTLAGVYSGVPSEMAACGESAFADLTDMFLLGETLVRRGLGDVGAIVVEGVMGRIMEDGVKVRVIRGGMRHVLSVRT